MVALANIDFSNNVSDNNSNIDKSKEEELQFSLNICSHEEVNSEEVDSDTFMEKSSDKVTFKEAELLNGSLKDYFVSGNGLKCSHSTLSKAEVSLLSKGLKFHPTPNVIGKSVLKEDLENIGRKLRLKWQYRNVNRLFDPIPFKPKSKLK